MNRTAPARFSRSAPEEVRTPGLVTIPNALSLLRILLLPPSLVALERQESIGSWPAVLTVICALATDALDGVIARWRGGVSTWGRVLDPLADKIYIGGLVLYLTLARDFPVWLVALVLGRDLFLVGASMLLLRRRGVVFSANVWGKLSMIALSVLVVMHLVQWEPGRDAVAALAGGTLVVSLVTYVWSGLRFVRQGKSDTAA